MCNFGLESFGEIERKMICIQRLFAFEDIPQEVKDAEIQVDTKKWPR
jgi:hypothetical protein